MSFNKPSNCGNILDFIQIHTYIWEKMDTNFFYVSYNSDLEWMSRSSKLI